MIRRSHVAALSLIFGSRFAAVLLAGALALALASPARAAAMISDPNCAANVLPANDDGYVQAPLGFTVKLGGSFYTSAFVVNNGYLLFDSFPPWNFAYYNLKLDTTTRTIVAPFMADVDTRDPMSDLVTYGPTTFGGRPALCVNWGSTNGVGYYDSKSDFLNRFQLFLVDRSDLGLGDFDIIMNYDQVLWDVETVMTNLIPPHPPLPTWVGFAPGNPYAVVGSGSVPSGLLDGEINALVSSAIGTPVLGRYIYELRNGIPPLTAVITGTTYGPDGTPADGAIIVAVSSNGVSFFGVADAQGNYQIDIPASELDGQPFTITAFPPSGTSWSETTGTQLLPVVGTVADGNDVVFVDPDGPPPDVILSPSKTNSSGDVVVYWQDSIHIIATGCPGGFGATYGVFEGSPPTSSTPIVQGTMTESPIEPGTYFADIPPLAPNHGWVTIVTQIDCPDGTADIESFGIYIDPSGSVWNANGNPIWGAQVTLYRSDYDLGPFEIVQDGSAIMSPANRENPMYSDERGHFGWDTLPGYYIVRAEKPGCTDADAPTLPYVDTDVLPVPPPVTDLALVLDCSAVPPPAITTPASLTVEAQSAAGAVVAYPASAWDATDGLVPMTCIPESGSLFPMGSTMVTCTATNSYGNVGTASFPVTVADTTAPWLSLPDDMAVYATTADGAAVSYEVSAVDAVDGAIQPACAPPPGSMFPPGETQVQCVATDAQGNASGGAFFVRVTYEFGSVLPPLSPDGTSVFKRNQVIPVLFSLAGASAGISTLEARLYIAPMVGGTAGPEQPAVSVGGGNVFVAHGAQAAYQLNLPTRDLSAGTYQLRIDLGDGALHTVLFTLID